MRLPTFYEQNLIPNWGNYNMMFLITESWDLSDEDKAFLLNTTPGAVRTMRSRFAKKKVWFIGFEHDAEGFFE